VSDLEDGAVRLVASDGTTFTFKRLRPGTMRLVIAGYDTGKLGDAPLDVLTAELLRYGKLDLLVDLRAATGVVTAVREAWTAWFQLHSDELRGVTILISDRLVASAVAVAKHFSRTGELIRVLSDAARFDELVAAAS
jgi:hypothetical protein